jgi:hypothetical protein
MNEVELATEASQMAEPRRRRYPHAMIVASSFDALPVDFKKKLETKYFPEGATCMFSFQASDPTSLRSTYE